MALKDHYPESYYGDGKTAPDYSRCCASINNTELRWYPHYQQCSRKNGHGPDGAYCKQHDPAAVARRKAESDSRHDAAWAKRRKEIAGPRWFEVLKQIADGHNDPRSLAQEAIKGFDQCPPNTTDKGC